MRHFWSTLLVLTATLCASAQKNALLDSLRIELGKDQADSSQVNLYNQISDEFARDYKLLDSAIAYAGRAHQLALEINFPQGKAAAANRLAYAYDLAGKLKDALNQYELARQYYSETNNPEWVANRPDPERVPSHP